MKTNHMYRVTVYLGKDNYGRLQDLAQAIGMPIATVCRLLLSMGISMGEQMEKGDRNNAKW